MNIIAESKMFFLPDKYHLGINLEYIIKWYNNILIENEFIKYQKDLKKVLYDYYNEAGLIDNKFKKEFFYHHYAKPMCIILRSLFKDNAEPCILDLGCGSGTQSILFALLGAKVVSVDIDSKALELFELRKKLYEKVSGKELNITIVCNNTFEFKYENFGLYNGVYSLFAFNMMQPSAKLLDNICPYIENGGVFIIQDGNKNAIINRLFRPRQVMSKNKLEYEFDKRGFRLISKGLCSTAPVFWQFVPSALLSNIDDVLSKSELLTLSYLHIATKHNVSI